MAKREVDVVVDRFDIPEGFRRIEARRDLPRRPERVAITLGARAGA